MIMLYDVFISYRRTSGSEEAELIQSVLTKRGYKASRIFMDTHTLGAGHYKDAFIKAIDESLNVIVVVTKDCFKGLTDDSNWAIEIREAMTKGKNIIPIYFDGISSISQSELPDSLKEFPMANAVLYVHQYSEASYDLLCSLLIKESKQMPDWAKWAAGAVASAGLAGGAVSLIDNGKSNDQKVYIIESPTSHRYHYKEDCISLKNSKHPIKTVSLEKAIDMGKTPCGICTIED